MGHCRCVSCGRERGVGMLDQCKTTAKKSGPLPILYSSLKRYIEIYIDDRHIS